MTVLLKDWLFFSWPKMSKTREEFLGAIENQNWEDFLNYIEKNVNYKRWYNFLKLVVLTRFKIMC